MLKRGLEHKNDANRLFKLGRLRTAFKRYKKSIDYLIIARQWIEDKIKTFNEISEENKLDLDELKASREKVVAAKAQIYSNLALCQIKARSYNLALENCRKCLAIDEKNVKALFRSGQARMGVKDYEEASADFRVVLEIEPDNQEARTSLASCERLRKEYEKELSSNLKKMFTS